MDEQELIDTLRRRLDQPGSNQQSIIRRLREERRGKGEHHGKDQ